MLHFRSTPDKNKTTSVQENDLYYVVSSSMTGWRVEMQDAHTVLLMAPDDNSSSYFAVFDGHSGRSVAEYASLNLHRVIMTQPEYLTGNIQEAIHEGFIKLDNEMRSVDEIIQENAGSTACVVVINGRRLICGNAGDSRAIVYRGGSTINLSNDHKPTNSDEMARIYAAGGHVNYDRVNGRLAVSRGFGDFHFKNNPALTPPEQVVSCAPDVIEMVIDSSLKFLFLACDGIFETMSSVDVGDFIISRLNASIRPETILEELLDNCCAATDLTELGADNMTAILVLFKKHHHPKLTVIEEEETREVKMPNINPQPGPSKKREKMKKKKKKDGTVNMGTIVISNKKIHTEFLLEFQKSVNRLKAVTWLYEMPAAMHQFFVTSLPDEESLNGFLNALVRRKGQM